jgi:hypothetical protein
MNAHSASAAALSELPATLPDPLRDHLRSARQIARHVKENPANTWATGVAALDQLLLGGLHRGQLIELIGSRTCGRYSLVLAVLAAASERGEVTALIDLGDSFDPQSATTAGVILERLLWVRPPHLKQALIATETILAAGFPLVVLDLGLPPIPGGRGAAAAWLRLARAADAQENSLFVTAPYRVSGTAASAVLRARKARPLWNGHGASPRLLTGMHSRLEVEKFRGQRAGSTAAFELVSREQHRLAVRPADSIAPISRNAGRPAARQAG